MAKLYSKLCGALNVAQDPFLLMVRLYWGFGFFMAGKGKLLNIDRTAGFFTDLGIPMAKLSAVLAGSAECFGGLLLMAGLLSRLASIPLVFTMLVAFATAHRDSLVIFFQNPSVAFKEDPFLFLFVSVIVMFFGPGKWSVDYFLQKKYCRECN